MDLGPKNTAAGWMNQATLTPNSHRTLKMIPLNAKEGAVSNANQPSFPKNMLALFGSSGWAGSVR